MQNNKAVLVLDVINELVHSDGSVGKDGFYAHSKERQILSNIKKVIDTARLRGVPVFYVIVGFSANYTEWSASSKLFKNVPSNKQVILGDWSTEVHESIAPNEDEAVIKKNRIDPFFNTNLDLLLRTNNINEVVLSGVSSEFVILSTALSAHDRDYKVTVLEDCISSSDQYSHECAVHIINKIADVVNSEHFLSNEKI